MLRTFREREVLYGCAQEVCGRGLRVRAILVPHGGVFGRHRASPAGGRCGGQFVKFDLRGSLKLLGGQHSSVYTRTKRVR